MLSYHRFLRVQIGYKGGLTAFARDWVSGRIWPSSWQEHVNSWLAPAGALPGVSLELFRYEDFIENPLEATIRLSRILGAEAPRSKSTRSLPIRTRTECGHVNAMVMKGLNPASSSLDLRARGSGSNGLMVKCWGLAQFLRSTRVPRCKSWVTPGGGRAPNERFSRPLSRPRVPQRLVSNDLKLNIRNMSGVLSRIDCLCADAIYGQAESTME